MPPSTRFSPKFQSHSSPLPVEILLDSHDGDGNPIEWVVWAYHGLVPNRAATSQTNAIVAFRRLGDKVVLEEVLRSVPLAALNIMPIGSVWHDGRSERQAVLKRRTFDVDYDEGQWRFHSFARAEKNGTPPPYPRTTPPLKPSADEIEYLELGLGSGGGKLVIPCIEFLVRTYGYSHELRQVLLGNAWEPEGSPHSKLYDELKVLPPPGDWAVRLHKRLDNRDALILRAREDGPVHTVRSRGPQRTDGRGDSGVRS